MNCYIENPQESSRILKNPQETKKGSIWFHAGCRLVSSGTQWYPVVPFGVLWCPLVAPCEDELTLAQHCAPDGIIEKESECSPRRRCTNFIHTTGSVVYPLRRQTGTNRSVLSPYSALIGCGASTLKYMSPAQHQIVMDIPRPLLPFRIFKNPSESFRILQKQQLPLNPLTPLNPLASIQTNGVNTFNIIKIHFRKISPPWPSGQRCRLATATTRVRFQSKSKRFFF